METIGANMAVTEDGASYNKLKRPDDFMASIATPSTDDVPALVPVASAKRTLDEAEFNDQKAHEATHTKRTRVHDTQSKPHSSSKLYVAQTRTKKRQPLNMENGMHSMFPGMLDEGEFSDDDTAEALAYLRSVRSEAQTIPQLLVAAPPELEDQDLDRSMYNSGRGDARALYEDGAWVARGDHDMEYSGENSSMYSEELDAQEQYYRKLLWRYEALRKNLELLPQTSKAPSRSDKSKNIVTEIPSDRHGWLYVLDREYPAPGLVSQMSEQDVFRGLKYCAQSLDRFRSITKQKSCWIWTLLAISPEVGTLDYVRVGNIRDLGHKAGQLGMRLRNGMDKGSDSNYESEEVEDWEADGDGINENDDEDSSSSEQINDDKGRPVESTAKEKRANYLPTTEKGSDVESGAEMSISEDEKENQEDGKVTLEQAKARLLAQLGDRLIQPQSGPITQAAANECGTLASDRDGHHHSTFSRRSRSVSPPRTKRHRHNGKVCHDPSCSKARRRRHPHKNTTSNQTAQKESFARNNHPFPSRMEAEAQRQQLCESEIEPQGRVSVENVENIPEVHIPDLNSKVTIDMILTIVAECYGQKDLLRFRDNWAE